MTLDAVDLSNCDREPIHIPGAIQPHGVLVVCRADDLTVTHVSENVERVLGVAVSQVIGRRVGELFLPDESAAREAVLRDDVRDGKPVYLFTMRLRSTAGNFDAIAHRSGDSIYLEFEPTQEVRDLSAPELYRLLQGAATRLSGAGSVDDLYRVAAEHVREINGFDRVMVYRFDEEWNGQVVAESRRDNLEPFLGLHYPASDIPRQARELYVKNWLRFIADRDYVAARVVPETGPDSAAPLDMSFCVLRSVSPIHLEYLRNMGVAASMSISLVRDGRLWGLIACHHYSPRFVPYDVRTACELLGRLMSLTLSSAEDRERDAYRTKIHQAAVQLIGSAERSDDLAQALIESTPGALDFLDADGAALCNGTDVWRVGQTPSDDEIRRLTLWLAASRPGNVFCTDRLPDLYGSELLESIAAGLMAVSLGSTLPHYLLWFRAEQVRTVDWAGDPAKSVVESGEEVRLSPRGSFALWKETVRGRSRPWSSAEVEAAANLRDGLMRLLLKRTERLIAANLDLRAAGEEREKLLERERAARSEIERINRMKDEFVATLSHELRSPLNAILGWSQLLAMRENLDEETAQGLDIIERNARSQAHMIEDLLDVSRIISGKLRLNLQAIVVRATHYGRNRQHCGSLYNKHACTQQETTVSNRPVRTRELCVASFPLA